MHCSHASPFLLRVSLTVLCPFSRCCGRCIPFRGVASGVASVVPHAGAAPKVLRVQRGHFEGVTGRVQLPADASEASAAAAPALPAKTATVERSVTRRANVAKAPTVRRPSAKRESSGTPKVAAEPAPAPAAAAAASPAPTKPLPPAPAASSTAVAKPSLAKRARSAARSVKKTVVALARKIGRPARSRQAESAAGKGAPPTPLAHCAVLVMIGIADRSPPCRA